MPCKNEMEKVVRKLISRCDNCDRCIYEDDIYFEGELGKLRFTLCANCCELNKGDSDETQGHDD